MNEDRLRQHLADKAATVEVSPGDPADLKPRTPNPLVIMGAGLALVTVLGAGLVWLLPADDGEVIDLAVATTSATDEGIIGAGPLDEAAAETTPAQGETSLRAPGANSDLPAIAAGDGPTLEWQGGQFPEGVFLSGITPRGDGFVAWGQGPYVDGQRNVQPAFLVFESSDGLEWTEVPTEGLNTGDDFWISTMLATDSRLIAAGMAWDVPSEEDVYLGIGNERAVIFTSQDGTSWESIELGSQAAGPTGNPGEFWSSSQPMLAVKGDLVVLIGNQTLSLDPFLIIEDKLAGEDIEIHGMGYGEGGVIEVYGPGDGGRGGDNLIASFTAEELGVDPALLEGYGGPLDTATTAYVSSDGGATFEAVEPAGLDDLGYASGIVTTAEGFVVTGEVFADGGYSGQASWRTSDGVTWVKSEPIGGGSWFNRLESNGDFIVGAGDGVIVSFDGGATFSRVTGPAFDPVDGLNYNVEQVSTGPAGTIGIGSAWEVGPPPPPLEIEVDGRLYREIYRDDYTGGPTVVVTDIATGEVLFEKEDFWSPDHITYAFDGDETVTFNSPDTGEPVMTLSWFELDSARSGDEEIVVERDGLLFTASELEYELGRVVITDTASGDILFDVEEPFSPSWVDQDDEGYTIVDTETGEPIIRIDYAALEVFYTTLDYEEQSYQEPLMALWYSPDGMVWSRQSMTEAFGDSGYTQATAVGIDRVVVTFQPHDGFAPESEEEARTYVPPPTQVWVGTLP